MRTSGTGVRRLVIFWTFLSYRWPLSAEAGGRPTAGEWTGKDNKKYVCLTWCCGCSFSKGTELNAGYKPSWEPVPLSETKVQLPPLQGYLSVYGLRDLSLCLSLCTWFSLSFLLASHLKWTKCLLCSLLFLLSAAGKSLHGDNQQLNRICKCGDNGWAWIR